ncbi:hypothetical protein CCHL11_02264 [Colletotrichum chlorophyti]|uniref:Uncharacterized protein n=1 Tax=Colletotrichum chlorophyti TaxID=708187 RepID=A0A1Q8S5Q9_9PEZI|nr:hypothetical protein CCHL11_02264 [Colletotrichum chlorophyti]
MVTTRNGKRTAADAPAAQTTTKKQKQPARGKDAKAPSKKETSKKDEGSRSSSKKRSSLVVELKSESKPRETDEVKEQQIITGPEQPAPEVPDDKVIDDSEASAELASDAREAETTEKKTALIAQPADDDSDSDEAPEAVSTSKAAAEVKKSARAANKALAEQAAVQKRKRQERNARLQEQAAARKAQKEEETAADAGESDEGEQADKPEAVLETAGHRRFDKRDLPDELPAEFLNSDSEEEEGDDETGRKPRKARKLHTAEAQIARESRGPKDEVVGTTLFRVVKKENERLAPKSHKASVNAKKALLTRGRTPVKARKGFLV